MRQHVNAVRRIRSIKNSLSEFMYSEYNYLVCNSIHEYAPLIQNRQSYLNCHIDRLDKDGLFDRKAAANVYHY